MSLRERLLNGETISPDDESTKSAVTSVVSQLRKQGVDIETMGHYHYRLAQTQNGNGHASTSGERPPMPGEHLVLDLTVTGLRLDEDESLLVTASDGTHEFEFPW